MENKVTLEVIINKIVGEMYLVLPDGRTTVCMLTMQNGYTVKGMSACVDASNFDMNIGRKIAFEDAIRQIWPLEGYLLAERLFWDRAQPVASNPPAEAPKKVHWTQTPEGKKKMAARKRKGAGK
jgi:hypothetical protein